MSTGLYILDCNPPAGLKATGLGTDNTDDIFGPEPPTPGVYPIVAWAGSYIGAHVVRALDLRT
jgi:hypothetical protein